MSYRVAVRALCEFTDKVGDLDLRFTPSPSALEGMAGHRRVTQGRSAGYQTEVALSGEFHELQVRGRADGYDPALNRLEEIKTHRGDLALQPQNHRQLHWAQAKVYAWLMCQSLQLEQMDVALVYFDVDYDKQTLFSQHYQAAELQAHYERLCTLFLAWARQELSRKAERDLALTALKFPHGTFRAGQRELAETVYKAVSTGRCLMAQATTGIGKTLGTLFPLLKAVVPQQLDKILFLSAKTPGRALALEAVSQLHRQPGLPLRTLEMVARDKACEHPDKACHGESCPLAKGFYDRLPAAREAAVHDAILDQATVRRIALEHQVCPYYLSQELARWVDIVIGDYNYYFDLNALLFGLAQEHQWQLAVLVDESHNLVDRARGMYSATLDQSALQAIRKAPPAKLKSPLQRLNREWNALYAEQIAPYQVHPKLPDKFILTLLRCISLITDEMNAQPQGIDRELLDFYFQALQFTRVAELFDEHYLFDVTRRDPPGKRAQAQLCLRNVVPAPLLAPRLGAARSAILFSATLSPRNYYADLLGLPKDCAWIDVQSPFSASQLEVRIVDSISTRFNHRQASLGPIAELIAQQYLQQPGNYLAFFSSFDYLQQVQGLLAERYPQIDLWAQARRMDESARRDFLGRFTEISRGVGFAVLGGAFGEGIDLPGARLIGAFIATLGLAQLNPVNEQIKGRMNALFGSGYDYTYLYPGLCKVVQAAGRVIRGQDDRGVVVLIDDRFAEGRVKALFPRWWEV